MLAKYEERRAVRQGRWESRDGFDGSIDPINPTSNDLSFTTLKNYQTEMDSHLMLLGLSEELST